MSELTSNAVWDEDEDGDDPGDNCEICGVWTDYESLCPKCQHQISQLLEMGRTPQQIAGKDPHMLQIVEAFVESEERKRTWKPGPQPHVTPEARALALKVTWEDIMTDQLDSPWISISESLPPKHPQAFTSYSRRVLVRIDSDRDAQLAIYDVHDKRWTLLSEHLRSGEVTHWMPIPPAPKARR